MSNSTVVAPAVSHSSTPEAISLDASYIPLGYTGLTCHVWSSTRNCIISLSPTDIISPGALTIVCGNQWLKQEFGYSTGQNGSRKINYREAGAAIVDECNRKGSFNVAEVYGTGVWRDAHDPDCLIVNDGNDIWRTDGRPQARVNGRRVFVSHTTLGLKRDQDKATPEDAQVILDALDTWGWRKGCDSYLMLGWIAAASMVGALDWRVHAAITSKPGCGKSKLIQMIRHLLGDFMRAFTGTTSEPAVRRTIQNDSLAVLVDEAEGTSNVKTLMVYLRASSGGDKDSKAKQGQSGVETYTVRCAGLISAVNLPTFEPADEGRYLPLTLVEEPKNKTCLPEIARDDNQVVGPLGMKLRSRMIHSWRQYRKTNAIIKSLLISEDGLTIRYADSLSTVLSAAWTALNDGVIDEVGARELIAKINFCGERDNEPDSVGDVAVLDHALDTLVNITVDGRTERITLRMSLAAAAKKDKDAERSVQGYGLRIIHNNGAFRLLIDERATEFRRLFKGTKWEEIDFSTALKRVPGASPKRHTATHIGGKTVRPLSLPFDFRLQD